MTGKINSNVEEICIRIIFISRSETLFFCHVIWKLSVKINNTYP